MKNNNILVILAAGTVNSNLNGDLGKILTSHIPISGQMALVQMIAKSKSSYSEIYVNMDQFSTEYIDYLKISEEINVINGNKHDDLDTCFEKILKNLPPSTTGVDILFGDSWMSDLITLHDEKQDVIYVTGITDSNLYSSILRDLETNSLRILSNENSNNLAKQITGSFRISDFNLFFSIFEENKNRNIERIFWETLIDYDKAKGNSIQLVLDNSWSDIGHIDNYFQARREYIKEASRYFNHVSIDPNSGLLRKSGPVGKIELEKKWFASIPTTLHKYVPILQVNQKPGEYEMEYLTSIPLNEMWISENNDGSYWQSFVARLEKMLTDLHAPIYLEKDSLIKSYELKKEIYVDKFNTRVESFLEHKKDLHVSNIKINGKSMPSLDLIRFEILKVSNRISNLNHWSIIHGDLCFSNLIFDRRKDQLFLIDPRGNFGEDGIFGDPIYDLAKLSHSIFGNYDYFASNLFVIEENNSAFGITTSAPLTKLVSRSLCEELLKSEIRKYDLDLQDLRIIESSLFLSAAELHKDVQRGMALFLRGIQIADEVLNC
jgi:thiamine kinase-like enzyme